MSAYAACARFGPFVVFFQPDVITNAYMSREYEESRSLSETAFSNKIPIRLRSRGLKNKIGADRSLAQGSAGMI
jgi:hypothetical protein